jgi:hypothetical protein
MLIPGDEHRQLIKDQEEREQQRRRFLMGDLEISPDTGLPLPKNPQRNWYLRFWVGVSCLLAGFFLAMVLV